MKYLLDTRVFLWTIADSNALPPKVAQVIRDPDNEVFLSSVSLWEIAIKVRIKKLFLDSISIDGLLDYAVQMGFLTIGLTPEEAVSYCKLGESSHADPFDRMLIWQSICRKMTIISKDGSFRKFKAFGLKQFWK